jgi:NADH dehydrogenase
MGIEVRLNTRVIDAREDAISLDGGEEIAATTLVWTAGVQTAKVAGMLGVDSVQNGRIPVEANLTLAGHPEVFVVGDMAYLEQEGRPLPMMAPVAIQGGKYAGRAILARELGANPRPFRYTDPVEASVIGRGKAVASIGRTNVTGLIAWLVWLLLHLQRIVSFRNRLAVLYNWMLDYIFFDRKVRLITGRTGDGSVER